KNPIQKSWANELSIFFSTDKGWIEKTSLASTTDSFFTQSLGNNEVLFKFDLGEDDEEIVAPTLDLHGREGDVPVVKFIFNTEAGRSAYLLWKEIELKEIIIDTETVYTENLKVKTDQGFIDTKNEFFPFGAVPKKGSVLKVH